MLLNHYRPVLLRVPFVLAVIASVVILFTPESGVPTAPPGTDKVVHTVLFGALAATGLLARLPRRPLLGLLIGYAAVSEVLQQVLPLHRSGDVLDFAVDLLGIALGWALTAVLGRRRATPVRG